MPLSPKIYRWLPRGILVLIFFSGLFVRAWQFEKRGIMLYDEAFYALEAKTFSRIPALLWPMIKNPPLSGAEGRELIHQAFPQGFFPTTTARPGYVFSVALAMLGYPGDDGHAALLFSVIVGALTVLAVYFFTSLLTQSKLAGVGAALLLALSPYHVLYSRMLLPHVFAALSLTMAAYAYIRSFSETHRTVFRWLFAAGLGLGWAFSIHVNVLPLIGFWILFEAIIAATRYRWDMWGRLGVFFSGFVIPLVIWQIVLWVKGRIMLLFGSAGLAESYWDELWSVLYVDNIRVNAFSWSDPGFYVRLVKYLDGGVFLFISVLAILFFFLFKRSRTLPYVFLYCLVTGFFLFYSFTAIQATRTFVVILPLLVSLVAIFIWYAIQLFSSQYARWIMFFGIIGLVLVFHLPMLATVLNLNGGYTRATQVLRRLSPDGAIIGSPWVVFQWHAKDRVFSSYDKDLNLARGGYFVADGMNVLTSQAEVVYEKNHAPLATLPNTVLLFYPLLRDVFYGWSGREIQKLIESDPHMGTIRIYAL